MSMTVKVGSAVGKYGTRLVLGAGYIALRGAYALGDAGEAAIEAGSLEAEHLGKEHEVKVAAQTAAAKIRIAEVKAKIAAERAARMADEVQSAAPLATA